MKRVVILGGAYDMIHRGHILCGEHLTQFYDEVWFMPCYGHAFGKKMSPERHRFNMVLLAAYGTLNCPTKFKVMDYEIDNKITTGTYETVKRLRSDFKDTEFTFAIGVDNAETIQTWENGDKLIEEVPFAVIPRMGFACTKKWFLTGKHCYLTEFVSPPYSSTIIRDLLRQKRDEEALAMLPNAQVYNYIKTWGLYV
jgi:nicotinate (nicotinamide) nucleotide adenylyltransferase